MSIVSSIVTTKARELHDGAIKLMAKWDPDSVGEAQITEWDNQARDLARSAARAETDAQAARESLTNIQTNVAKYAAAAEKLAATNEAAANKAADTALEWQNKLAAAEAEAKDASDYAAEVRAAAERAQRLVVEGREKIEHAKREQARAANEAAAMMGAVKAGKDAYVAPPVQTVTMANWTPPPPPSNPPHYLEPDHEREALAAARESVK